MVMEALVQRLNTPGSSAVTEAARALARMRGEAIKKAGPDARRWTGRVFGKPAKQGVLRSKRRSASAALILPAQPTH
jgi:hypothetical protein